MHKFGQLFNFRRIRFILTALFVEAPATKTARSVYIRDEVKFFTRGLKLSLIVHKSSSASTKTAAHIILLVCDIEANAALLLKGVVTF